MKRRNRYQALVHQVAQNSYLSGNTLAAFSKKKVSKALAAIVFAMLLLSNSCIALAQANVAAEDSSSQSTETDLVTTKTTSSEAKPDLENSHSFTKSPNWKYINEQE